MQCVTTPKKITISFKVYFSRIKASSSQVKSILFSKITSLTAPVIDWHFEQPVPNILII